LGTALLDAGDPSNAVAHLMEGTRWLAGNNTAHFDVGDLEHALPEALQYELGVGWAQLGNLERAEQHYREALRLAPDYVEANNNLGNLLLRSGRVPEAERFCLEAVKLMPDFAQANNNLGIICQKQGRWAEALAWFQKAVMYDTNLWQAHFNMAALYLGDAKPDKAIPELRTTLRMNPSFEPAQRALTKALGRKEPLTP
jgi:tetratricopeptide (TPR) repeat protein